MVKRHKTVESRFESNGDFRLIEDRRELKSSDNAGTCRVSGANYSSSSRTDEHTLKSVVPTFQEHSWEKREQAGWRRKKHTAVWKKVPFATAYQLQLFRNGDIVKTLTVMSNSTDLSEYMTEEGSYSYRVREPLGKQMLTGSIC